MNSAGKVLRLSRFGLTTGNAERLARFYEDAFDCRRCGVEELGGPQIERTLGVKGGARRLTLVLGDQMIELMQFEHPGAPYPTGSQAPDLIFQHFAIVVADIGSAFRHLSSLSGWSPITRGEPVRLPERSGGVIAFKFRDPEGHPLELLEFPASSTPPTWRRPGGLFRGIDHSAISVSDRATSTAYYQALGLQDQGHSLNHGVEQDRLDDQHNARVEVVALSPCQATPHLELLCYESGAHREPVAMNRNDIACTYLVFEETSGSNLSPGCRFLVDPDGHHLSIAITPELKGPA